MSDLKQKKNLELTAEYERRSLQRAPKRKQEEEECFYKKIKCESTQLIVNVCDTFERKQLDNDISEENTNDNEIYATNRSLNSRYSGSSSLRNLHENRSRDRSRSYCQEDSFDSDESGSSIKTSRRRTSSRSSSRSSERLASRSISKSPSPEEDEMLKDEDVKGEKQQKVNTDLPPYYPAIQGCRSVDEFQCLNRIEEGSYGVVYRAKDIRADEIVALKRLKMDKEKDGFPNTSLREINTLLKVQHDNIVAVREIVMGSNMDKIYLVMDYVEHDLKSLIEIMKHKKQIFTPGEVKCLLKQLLQAVAHLHDNWLMHRDLKPSNLLLSHKGILKVGDFGLAREYGSPLKSYTPIVVTLWYRAPELLLWAKQYSIPIDMWSVGCIFAELMSMNPLFPGKSESDQLNRISKVLGTPSEKTWKGFNTLPAVKKIKFDEYPVSNIRAKFNTLSEMGFALLLKLLTYDPNQRVTAEDAIKHYYFKESPSPIEPAMFPTWPAKSELGPKRALAANCKQGAEYDDAYGMSMDIHHGRAGFTLK